MTDRPDVKVDRTLRDAFRLDLAAVDRVAERALGASPPRRRSQRLAGLAVAATTVVVGVALVVWLVRSSGVAPQSVIDPLSPAGVSGAIVDGVLVLPIPDDGVVIVGPGQREDRPPDGYGVVLVVGEQP